MSSPRFNVVYFDNKQICLYVIVDSKYYYAEITEKDINIEFCKYAIQHIECKITQSIGQFIKVSFIVSDDMLQIINNFIREYNLFSNNVNIVTNENNVNSIINKNDSTEEQLHEFNFIFKLVYDNNVEYSKFILSKEIVCSSKCKSIITKNSQCNTNFQVCSDTNSESDINSQYDTNFQVCDVIIKYCDKSCNRDIKFCIPDINILSSADELILSFSTDNYMFQPGKLSYFNVYTYNRNKIEENKPLNYSLQFAVKNCDTIIFKPIRSYFDCQKNIKIMATLTIIGVRKYNINSQEYVNSKKYNINSQYKNINSQEYEEIFFN